MTFLVPTQDSTENAPEIFKLLLQRSVPKLL